MIAAAKTGAAIDEFGLAGLCRLRGSNCGVLLHGMEIWLETKTVGFYMKWILLAVLVSAVLLFLWSGFADVPCQDGAWDAFKQTCVPD